VEQSYLEKKFDTDYTGASFIGYIAYAENDEPAAFYGVFPVMMIIDGKRVLAAQSGDTMTAPKHQGKGLFTRLAKITYELAKAEGIELIFGFPNQNSYPGFKNKLGWAFTHNLILYKKRVYTLPVAPLASKVGALQKIYLGFIHAVFKKFSVSKTGIRFQNSNVSTAQNGIEYSDAYFRYRSFSNNYFVKLAGCTGWISVTNSLMIGDLQFTNVDQANKFLKSLKRICALTGILRMAAICSPGSPMNHVLSKSFDAHEHFPAGFLPLSERAHGFNYAAITFNAADLDTF
jgi:GNAT superfamily N-acetyltransferase